MTPDSNSLLKYIESHNSEQLLPDSDCLAEKLKVINAYYTLFEQKLLDEYAICSHFKSHHGLLLCLSPFHENYDFVPKNPADKETARRLKLLLDDDISEWLRQIRKSGHSVLPGVLENYYDVWEIARILWFAGSFELADSLVYSFSPDCYRSPNRVAAAFIHALVWAGKYDILKKHLPTVLREYAKAESDVFSLGFGTTILHSSASPEQKSAFARIYLDVAQDTYSLFTKEKRRKYIEHAIEVATGLDKNIRNEVKQLKKLR